jgi:hypothetical protein
MAKVVTDYVTSKGNFTANNGMGKIWQQILPDIVPISTLVSVDSEEPQTLAKTAGVRAET